MISYRPKRLPQRVCIWLTGQGSGLTRLLLVYGEGFRRSVRNRIIPVTVVIKFPDGSVTKDAITMVCRA